MTIFSPCRSQYGTRSGTRAIVPSSFMISQTTPAGFRPASRARSTAASVCPARWSTPPSRARSGKTWPGWTRSLGARGRVDRDLDRVRAVVRRDAGRDALARLDRDRERRPERRLVAGPSSGRSSSSSQRSSVRQRQIEPAPVRGHEIDRLGRRELRRDRQIALVLAVLVVDDDDEPARRGCPRSPPRSSRRGFGAASLPPGSPAHRSREQPLDVLREHVDLEVHGIARRRAPTGSSPQACGARARPRTRLGEAGDRQRDALDRDRALLDAVAKKSGGVSMASRTPSPSGVADRRSADSVDMALDVMAARAARRRATRARCSPARETASPAPASPRRRRTRACRRRPRPRSGRRR